MALLHQSLFTATNGTQVDTLTPAVGGQLFSVTAESYVQDNRAYTDTGWLLTLNDTAYPTANYVVRCVWRQVSGAPNTLRMIGRDFDNDLGDNYTVRINGTALELWKTDTNGANNTQLGSTYTISTSDGNDYTVELVMNGTAISVRWQGSTVIGPVTDSTHTAAGKVWVRPQNATSTTGWHLDTLEVDDNVSGGGSSIAAISSGFHVRNINR